MPLAGRHLLVLGWHNVEGTPCFPSRDGAGLAGFRDQLDWLGRHATVVPLTDALDRLRAGAPLPPRSVAITFDDGYRDNLELAVPELERRNMPATFFLVPGLLDRRVEPWWETAAWAVANATSPAEVDGRPVGRGRAGLKALSELLKRRDGARREATLREAVGQLAPRPGPDLRELFLDWDGAAELAERGFEIGSHSRDHGILAEETPEAQAADIAEARAALVDRLRVPATCIAYPNGTRLDYDAATVAAARAAGHRYGLTTRKGVVSRAAAPFEVRRVVVYPERGARILAPLAEIAWRRARRLATALPGRARSALGGRYSSATS
jgi:peptidoglycan/xylan/chitin deacetylase (PgdA/CDA1 family)